ncbi:hypothetical protein PAMP_000373 [Pampus punctatissimus]
MGKNMWETNNRRVESSEREEQGPGTVIGNIAKDARLGLEQTGQGGQGKKANFRVLENSAPHLIDVDPQSGLLYTKQRIDRETLCKRNPKCQLSMEIQGEIDYEESPVIEIDVQAKDLGPNPIPGHCKVTVKVLDRNDNWPSIGFVSVRQGAISEAAPPSTVIALVRVTDKDSGRNGQLQCRVLGNVPFKLEENYDNFYTVVTDRPLDREVQDEYNVTIVAKDNGIPPLNSTKSFTVKILDENDNVPRFTKSVYLLQIPENNIPGEYLGSVLAHDPDLGQNGTVYYSIINSNVSGAEIHVPRNVGVGYIVTTVRAVDNDYGESGRLTYEISDGNEEHLFEIDPVTGEVRTAHPFWDNVNPIVELIIRVSDNGKPTLTAAARLIIKASNGHTVDGLLHVDDNQNWDISLPLIVTLSIISIMLLAAMVTIAIKCKRENKEIRTYNCRIAEYSHPQLGKGKKKKINKNDIMLVQSEVEERDAMNVMNVVSSPSLATSPMYFDYQTRLPLSSPRSEVMYLKPTANNLSVPQGHVGCHTSFTGPVTSTTDTPTNRMSIIQTDNFPTEPNYMGSRQQFVQSSSTFKDPERASLRDSGHGDSDQADSDQDTNKGSCCDMSAKEALKLKATGVKPPPLEQADVDTGLSGSGRVAGSTLLASVEMTAIVTITNRQAAVVHPSIMAYLFVWCGCLWQREFCLTETVHLIPTNMPKYILRVSRSDQSSKKSALPIAFANNEDCVNCTEECRVLGHSDRCWMPQFPAGGNQAEGVDYRNNMFVPAGMETVPETETYETVNPNGKKTFCTFGKERRDHTILVANVKPYLKAKRALSPLLQEVPSASSSPTKVCSTMSPCSAVKSPADGAEGKPPPATCSSHYGPPDGQYLSPTKQTRDHGVYPTLPPSDPVAKVLAEARSRISQETTGEIECVLEQVEPEANRDGMDADQVTTQTITASDMSDGVSVHVLCIWASVTPLITAQCTSEHPVFKCQLSGRRTVTVLSQICCPCDTMCLAPVYIGVSCCISNNMN